MSNTNTEKEAILIMLLTEAVRRLSKNGKNPIHITNGQIERNLEADFEVDYSKSDSTKFVLKLVKGESIVLEENVELPPSLNVDHLDGLHLSESTDEGSN